MKNKYEIHLRSGKSLDFKSSHESVAQLILELEVSVNSGDLFIGLNDDIKIRIDDIEMIRRVKDE